MNWRRRAIPHEQGHIHNPTRIKLFFTILMFMSCFLVSTRSIAADIPAIGGYYAGLGLFGPTNGGGPYSSIQEAITVATGIVNPSDPCSPRSPTVIGCYGAVWIDESIGEPQWQYSGPWLAETYNAVGSTAWRWSRRVRVLIETQYFYDGSTTPGGSQIDWMIGVLEIRYQCPILAGSYLLMKNDPAPWGPDQPRPPQLPTCTDGLPTAPPPPPPAACSGQGGYTIRLQGPGGTDSALANVEPGSQVATLRANVTCAGQPVSGKQIALAVDVITHSGGHQHDQGRRPQQSGTASFNGSDTTDANGDVSFTFTAPAPAGDHTITAGCSDGSCGTDTGSVWVGIQGLVSLYDTHLYRLVGSDGVHPNNHYLTIAATGSVVWLAELYRARFPNDPVLYLNDASLERGGLFDINYPARIQWWTPPHITHRRGIDVDVRANEFVHADAIPHRNYFDFEEIAIDVGCIADMHSEFTRNQHYHVTCG